MSAREELPPRLSRRIQYCRHTGEQKQTAKFIESFWTQIPKLDEPFERMELEISRNPSGFHMRYINARYLSGDSEPHSCLSHEATVHDISGWLIEYACEASREFASLVSAHGPDPLLLADAIAAKAGHDTFIDYICSNADGRSQVYRFARAERERKSQS